MKRLADIPVRAEGLDSGLAGGGEGGLGDGVVAVLHEIAAQLQRLHDHGETGVVDLGTMPMAPKDYEQLRSALGEGEVDASLHAEGISRVRETGVHGVWWLELRDADGGTLAELIEITTVPRILQTSIADVEIGLERIGSQLRDAHGGEPGPGGDEHG